MSRFRLVARLRTNADFKALSAFLDGLGLAWSIERPTGKGHPALLIELPNGELLRHTVTCTPRGGGNPLGAIAYLRRAMRAAGYDPG